jgi:hypothetical protein
MTDGEIPLLAPEEISDLDLSETALPASYSGTARRPKV